jgi:hypothetical protein
VSAVDLFEDQDDAQVDGLAPAEEPIEVEPEAQDAAVVPLTDEEWERVLRGRKIRVVVTDEQKAWAGKRAVYCLGCDHAGKAHGDPRRAWCTKHKMLRGNTFPVLCREYRPA